MKRAYLSSMKDPDYNSMTNIGLSGEKLKAFSLETETRQSFPLTTTTSIEFSVRGLSKSNWIQEIKINQIEKEYNII